MAVPWIIPNSCLRRTHWKTTVLTADGNRCRPCGGTRPPIREHSYFCAYKNGHAALQAVAPSAEVHVLKECSHWIQNDRPEETNRLMRDFLARTDKTAAPAGADIVA